MKFRVLGIVTGLAFLTGACADVRLVDNVAAMKPAQPGFAAELHSKYVALAKAERSEVDLFDSGNFSRSAEAAAKGKLGEPDSLWSRDLTAANALEAHTQRGRLMNALDNGGREKFPELAATAQTQFDCWVQEVEENNQPDDIRKCREGYDAAILALEAALKPKPVAKAPEPPKPAPAPAPEVTRKFLVFFDFDSSKLTADAKTILKAAVDTSKQTKVTVIEATGHADRSGPDRYNLALSESRAAAVKAELIRLGVPTREIVTAGKGEREPLVQTPDGAREPQNRRVEINLK
jgi:OOP family OmpA-OmpF porin